MKKEEQMMTKKSWVEFKETGLFAFINSILHAFGWAIVIENMDDDEDSEEEVYPTRVKFRGFSEDVTSKMYERIGKYLKKNADVLEKESNS